MSGHTRGPWKTVANNIVLFSVGEIPGTGRVVWSEETGDIAYALFHDAEVGNANARLIAAAPEMLEALLALMGAIRVAGLHAPPATDMAAAAIAKAMGEP